MRTLGYNSRTSWIVALGCFVIGFLIMIPMRLAGLFFIIIIDRYNSDRMIATIPITLFGMLRSLTGPLSGYLGKEFGLRTITLSGCVLASIGVGACFFAEDVYTVIIYLGLIYGIGFGLGLTLVPEILKRHFNEDINLVNGLFLSGSCLGAIIMPQVIQALIYEYGYSGMFLILSGILFHTVPASILFNDPKNDEYEAKVKQLEILNNHIKSASENTNAYQNAVFASDNENLKTFEVEKQVYVTDKFKKECYEADYSDLPNPITQNTAAASNQLFTKLDPALKDSNLCSNIKLNDAESIDAKYTLNNLCKNNSVHSVELLMFNRNDTLPHKLKNDTDPNDIKEKFDNSSKNHDVENSRKKVDDVSESTKFGEKRSGGKLFGLFRDPTFLLTMTVQSTHAFVTTLNWIILIDFARDRGISPAMSLYFLMFLPLSEMIGSVALCWVSDRGYMTRTNYCMVCLFLLTAMSVCMVYTFDFTTMMVIVLLFGFVSSSIGSTFPGIIHEFIEEEQQGMALASRNVLYAFLCVTKSPIIGYFRGSLGSYNGVYFIIAMCCTFGGVLVMFTPVLAKRRRNKIVKNNL